MAINPEEWKQRRAQKEQQRKEKEARQRKLMIRIGIAAAIAAAVIALVLIVVGRFTGENPQQIFLQILPCDPGVPQRPGEGIGGGGIRTGS